MEITFTAITGTTRVNSRVSGLSALLEGSRGPVMGIAVYPVKGRMGCADAATKAGVRMPAFHQDSFPGVRAWSPPV